VSKVLVAGHSEGADVASGAMRYLAPTDVTAVGFLASGGISQFFDLVMEGRRTGDATRAQQAFDELLAITGESPPASYQGFPKERFQTFAIDSTPLDDLASSTVPIFVAQGTADRNSAPESADAFVVELLRRDPKHPVHYLILAGLDHRFQDARGAGHAEDVLARFVTWASTDPKTRTVETVAFETARTGETIRIARLPPWLLASVLFALGLAGLSVPARKRVRVIMIRGLGLLASTLAGATVGLWWGVLSGVRESAVHSLAGALAGTLLATLWLVLTSRQWPRSSSV
jgi:hypothetical protein